MQLGRRRRAGQQRATIIVDPAEPPDQIQVGGVIVLPGSATLADIGWAATSSLVRVPTRTHAIGVETAAPDIGFDLAERRFVEGGRDA
jgi:hypothetical protein